MENEKSKGMAAFLATFPVIGVFGADKYYAGATTFGIFQTILTLTITGLLITIPWSWLSSLVLILSIFMGGIPYLYPTVKWAPVTNVDYILASIAIITLILIAYFRFWHKAKETFEKKKETYKKKKEEFKNRKKYD